ncbi:helix-turn-helix domain-containing protein [Streptomyces sp. NPDC004610]|uniref:helix-turn-helix domain-containing protein n=1 Tax=unclassified Streptomyces TaxID=2593676 RepID=UPI0033A3509E
MTTPIPTSAAMSAAEFRITREAVGFTQDALSMHLECSRRSVANWEDGTRPVPDDMRDAIIRLAAYTDGAVDALAYQLSGSDTPSVETYRDDETVPVLWSGMPASWHRAVVARVARRIPSLRITYGGQGQ